jgi:hypothetical protein
VHQQQPPEVAGVEHRLHRGVLRVEAPHEADLHQRSPAEPLGLHQPQGRLRVHGQWLLAQRVLAVLEAGEHLLLVHEAG